MTFLIILHVLVCMFMVFVILLQPGKGDGGIGFGGSSSQSIFGSKGAGNFLTKTTSACAILFLITSFILTRSRMKEYSTSVISAEPAASAPVQPVTPPVEGAKPAEPAANAGAEKAAEAPAK